MSEMSRENEAIGKFSAVYDDNNDDYASQNNATTNSGSSSVINNGGDGRKCNGNNGLNNNNNHDEYKMDMKLNGNDKGNNAEEDPLTGSPMNNSNSNGGGERLKWRHRFASTNFFMVVFLVAYVLQGCYFTYFVSVITTIEKLFHIKSATIALLLNFSEVGQICTSLILTYFAGRGHRPRWIACGMFLFAIAAFGSVSPHFIYRDRLYNKHIAAASPSIMMSEQQQQNFTTFSNISASAAAVDPFKLNLCMAEDSFRNFQSNSASSCNADNNNNQGGGGETKDNDIRSYVLIILAVSLLGIGVGQTAIATLGIPCIDDNVKSKQSPLYMAITIGVRVFGPALGYYLGSLCTRISFDFAENVNHSDTNFIGAWYLGLLLVAITMFFASLVMFTFPKNLRNNKATKVQPAPVTSKDIEVNDEEKLGVVESSKLPKDFVKTIKRQVKNDILMFRTASAVLHLLPITGLYVFLPKYLETQFHMSPTDANKITGTFGVLVMGAGIFITGVISVKFPLSARKVSLWIAFTALATAFGMFILSLLGCPMDNYAGLVPAKEGGGIGNSLEFLPICESPCKCDEDIFAPICGSDGKNYHSACHAGCTNATTINGRTMYTNCNCIPKGFTSEESTASESFCGNNCNKALYTFIAVFAMTVFIHSTSEVGGMLIIMRCTHPKDKAMAMGIVQFSLGLLSNIPCPNIYGRIIDATCIIFAKICGNPGHCLFYNSDNFRKLFFGVSCFIMLLAFIMDVIVYFKSHRIDIDGDGGNDVKEIPLEDTKGSENLLKMPTKLFQEGSDDDQHTKISV